MKKRIIRITIFVILLLVSFGVNAEERYDIATVNSNLEIYNTATSEYASNNCEGTLTSQALVDKCNTLGKTRNNALVYLYNAKEYNEDLISSDVQAVLDQNSSQCSSVFSTDIQETFNKVFMMFYIAGPILLLIFGSMDFINAIVAGDEKKRKKLYTQFVRRAIALLLLFAAPVLVRVLVNTFGGKNFSSNVYSCSYRDKKITLSYTPVIKGKKKNKNSANASKILEAAAAFNKVTSSNDWSYDCVGIGTALSNYRNRTYGAHICCADFVSAVLVEAGVFSESEIRDMPNYNKEHCGGYGGYPESATGLFSFLITHEDWTQITDVDDLQAGDIMFTTPMTNWNVSCVKSQGYIRPGHVEIYAGDGMKYNAGYTPHIQHDGPVKASLDQDNFVAGLRAP
jgi:hypothetical protein